MSDLPHTPELETVARHVIWFESPAKAFRTPYRFIAYALTYGRAEDVAILRRHVSDDALREALEHAPPGIMDARPWTYWNLKLGRQPVPPLPPRRFDRQG